jgi:hypothetical protein
MKVSGIMKISMFAAGLLLAASCGAQAAGSRTYFSYDNDTAIDGSELIGPIRAHGLDKSTTIGAIAAFTLSSAPSLIGSAISAQAPGIVDARFASLFSAALGAFPAATQTATGSFWGAPAGASAKINRFADRVFMGPAVNDDGLFWPAGCPTCGGGATNHTDWLELLTFQSYGGGPGVFSDGSFAQVYILADPNSAPAAMAVPVTALAVAAETLHGTNGSTVRGMDLTVVDNAVGSNPGAWGLYLEAHHVGTSTTNTYGIELEARNSGTPSRWDPYFTTPAAAGVVGMTIGCGAGLPATGQTDCTVGLQFGGNPMPFQSGILFFPGSIAPTGPSTSYSAIQLPTNYSMQWYTGPNTLGATLTGAADGGLVITGSHVALTTGYLAFGALPVGVPSLYACFTAAGVLIASSGVCN